METKPPEQYISHEWHWLCGERASSPVCCQWLWRNTWYSPGEYEGITTEEMYRRGWRWYAPAILPATSYDDKPEIPDFGIKTKTLFANTNHPLEIIYQYVVPEKTFQDLMTTFIEAEKDWSPEDDLSGNPSKWQNARGVHAVLSVILEAIYLHNSNIDYIPR